MFKKILKYTAAALVALALTALVVFALIRCARTDRELECRGMAVKLEDTAGCCIIGEREIMAKIVKDFGDPAGQKASQLNLSAMEESVRSIEAVSKCDIFIGRDAFLHVETNQKKPVLELEKDGKGVFICADGSTFPLQPYKGDIRKVEGPMPELDEEGTLQWRQALVKMVGAVGKDPTGRNMGRILCDSKGNITMLPLEGKEQFLFGKPENIQEKLSLAGLYYSEIKPAAQEEGKTYRKINLKYKKQIICR